MYKSSDDNLLPKISVIVPVYNVEKYLSRCLDSVLTQTFKNFELICVNDGSQDVSAEILEKYAINDARIIVINQENQGLSMARNNGLKQAQGEFIYFLDSDDAIQPQTLDIAYNLACEHQADLVCWSYSHSDGFETPNKFYKISELKFKLTDNPIFFGNMVTINACTKMYRKSLLDGIEFIPHIHFEDFPHTYAVFSKKPKTILLQAELYLYTHNPESISHQQANPKQIKDYQVGIDYIYDIYNKPNLKKELSFLKRSLLPVILKHQYGRCRRAKKDIQSAMWQAFTIELINLQSKGLLSWRGHKLSKYFMYKKLIRKKI